MKNVKNKIAITGCTGSGKSTVCDILRHNGYYVFDVDKCNHELLMKDQTIKLLKEDFADAIIDNKVDKVKLANIIFNNNQKRYKLEKIMHALILEEMQKQMQNHDLFIAEVPTLFEAGWDIYFDHIIMVYAPEDIAIKRLIEKGYTNERAKKVLEIQMKPEIKMGKSDFVLYNDGTFDELKTKVINLIEELL